MNQIGIIGLGTMGANLARNFARNQIKTAVYNRTTEVSKNFITEYGSEGPLVAYDNLNEFIQSLESPKKIMLLVTAGSATEAVIQQLSELLSPEDIIIDGGNTNFKDTIRRTDQLKAKKINFIGCGVSGGEKGALEGPSLMPGGDLKVLEKIMPLLEKIAAKDFSGNPCVHAFEGVGAGNLIKTVHNGIEYAIMQVLADAYEVLRKVYNLKPDGIAEIFANFNRSELNGFLLETAIQVLKKEDTFNQNDYLINYISDEAGSKGTGAWTVETALEYGVPTPSIAAALFARQMSGYPEQRLKDKKHYSRPLIDQIQKDPIDVFVTKLEQAVWMASISSFIQGLRVIDEVSLKNNWGLYTGDAIRVWQGGCIIRTQLLKYFPLVENGHLLEPKLSTAANSLAYVISNATKFGVSIPALSASYDYVAYSTDPNLPTSFVQGLRDCFGAHSYKRNDRDGVFTENW
jgi:6-phosphogluconate dehydrogenase